MESRSKPAGTGRGASRSLRVALFGAQGRIGSRIASELRRRGHAFTPVVRERAKLREVEGTGLVADVREPDQVVEAVSGYDAVIAAVGGPGEGDTDPVAVAAVKTFLEALPRAGVSRLLVVGGAGSLEAAPGVQRVDMDDFPDAWKPASLAQREALQILRKADTDIINWTYLSPADVIEPGHRSGRYLVGIDELVRNNRGESWISMEDYAVALVDELERSNHARMRFAVAGR